MCQSHKRIRQDIVYVLPLSDPKFVGMRFTVTFFQGRNCNHPYVASYSGDREDGRDGILTNCKFSIDEQGNKDKEVILIPLNHQRFPSDEPIKVIAEFKMPDSRFSDGYQNFCFEDEVTGMEGGTIQSQIIVNAIKGDPGLSAYEVAVKHGFQGTEKEWIEGHNAYELWLEAGNVGTKEDFFLWLYRNSNTDEYLDSIIDNKLASINEKMQTIERNAICIGDIVGIDDEVEFEPVEEEPEPETPSEDGDNEAIKNLQERMATQEKINAEQQVQIDNNTTENERQQTQLNEQQKTLDEAATDEDIDNLFE